jgi:DnaJ-class molecular chaperone
MIERDAYQVLQVDPEAHRLVIQAAYRVLATLYHPDRDQSGASTRRMAELNLAYAKVNTAERRALYDRQRTRRAVPTAAVVTPYESGFAGSRATKSGSAVLDFGRYTGWTLKRLARHDPDYLRWLSRHSSGIRYRPEIEALLRESAVPTMSERTQGDRD